MKKMLLVFLLIPILLFGQQWRQSVARSLPSLSAVTMVDASTGWTVGVSGSIYKTTDGGLTWNPQTSGVTTTLGCVAFTSTSNGFIGTTNRTLLKTTNGGSNWASAAVTEVTEATATIKAIKFVSSTLGYMLTQKASDTSRVMKTTDGGATWKSCFAYKLLSTEDFLNMDFNGTTGVISGKPHTATFATTNGGDNWTRGTFTGIPPSGVTYSRSDLWAVCVASPTVVYAAGWGSSAAGLQPSIFVKSTDGGLNWTYMNQSAANRTYKNINWITFKSPTVGMAFGAGLLMSTVDGGTTWTKINAPMGSSLNCASAVGDLALVVGDDGVIMRTTDFGTTGSLVTQIPAGNLLTMQFTSASVGYAAGFNGVFLKTTDGGKNWKGDYVYAGTGSVTVNDIYFVDDNTGYVAANNRQISKTTNGGKEWITLLSDTTVTSYNCYGIWFTSATNGIVVGQKGSNVDITFRTTNGGATWDTTMNKVNKALRDVAFGDAMHGTIVGDGMKVLYTADGGATWGVVAASGVPTALAAANLKRVAYVNATTAFAAGGKVIIKSTDAGASWAFADSISDNSIVDVVFGKDGQTGYIVASKTVLKTTNAGSTWSGNMLDTSVTHQVTTYSGAVDASGNIWVGAAFSSMFTTALLTGVDEHHASLLNGFVLEQNYPNPFNPSTMIRYNLTDNGHTTLRIYDMLGRLVTTGVDQYQAKGSHDFRFDASRFSSGVYFYELSQGSATIRKSMMLLK